MFQFVHLSIASIIAMAAAFSTCSNLAGGQCQRQTNTSTIGPTSLQGSPILSIKTLVSAYYAFQYFYSSTDCTGGSYYSLTGLGDCVLATAYGSSNSTGLYVQHSSSGINSATGQFEIEEAHYSDSRCTVKAVSDADDVNRYTNAACLSSDGSASLKYSQIPSLVAAEETFQNSLFIGSFKTQSECNATSFATNILSSAQLISLDACTMGMQKYSCDATTWSVHSYDSEDCTGSPSSTQVIPFTYNCGEQGSNGLYTSYRCYL